MLSAVVEGKSMPSEPPPFCVHPEILPKAEDIFSGIIKKSCEKRTSQNGDDGGGSDDDGDDDGKPWRLPPLMRGQGPVNLIVTKTTSKPSLHHQGKLSRKCMQTSKDIIRGKRRGRSCQDHSVQRTEVVAKAKASRQYHR